MPGLVIVGPTASGKTALALALAERLGAAGRAVEIVSADAMALYAGMDVGTAKPSAVERAAVRHHLVDVVTPADDYSLSRFKADADEALAGISERGANPIVVGGTGLYVQALVDDLDIPGQFPDVAAELEAEPDTAVLHARLAELDPAAATKMEPTNRRRILRALEVTVGSGRPFSSFGPGIDAYPPTAWTVVGLEIDRDTLDARIDARYDAQLAAGFLDEVVAVEAGPGFGRTAAQALGYRELRAHLAGECSLGEAMDEARRRTRRFARRQQRWFRRDPRITWLDALAPDLADRAEAAWQRAASAVDGPTR
ncbi:MAG: tRNA (adenosine(37)-N6)-dimethylallyltransferase MiaA [Acidimicrobiales bacterium]